jgi:hypothetical protein
MVARQVLDWLAAAHDGASVGSPGRRAIRLNGRRSGLRPFDYLVSAGAG